MDRRTASLVICFVLLLSIPASESGYVISVKTSDVFKAGTNAHVFIKLFGAKNEYGSSWVRLDNPNNDDFETGSLNTFTVPDSVLPDVGEVYKMEIMHDKSGWLADWHLDYVFIQDFNRSPWSHYHFPCRCWLDDNHAYKVLTRKVNGGWSSFGEYGSCSRTCGNGVQTSYRRCNNPKPYNGGLPCSGSNLKTKSCFRDYCPVNGAWSHWSGWQSCTRICGGGKKVRARTCTNPRPAYGGRLCSGATHETQSCNTQDCPVHGGWSDWQTWSICSKTCGGGVQSSRRTCNNPTPEYGGMPCTGDDIKRQTCNNFECPVNGGWSNWTIWSNCSESCGGGDQIRSRSCTNPPRAHGGLDCVGDLTEARDCNTEPCIINGGWSVWSNWTNCSSSCGGGIQTSNRTCTISSCEGNATRDQPCHSGPCPVDGNWTSWSKWTECSASCDGGTQTSTRSCTNPPQSNGGKDCIGMPMRTKDCNMEDCPVNGSWSEWSNYTTCPVSCGGSVQISTRSCTNPPPSSTGEDCKGDSNRTKPCNTQECPVNGGWSNWTDWTPCTKLCDGGLRTRNRSCSNPTAAFGGLPCIGDDKKTESCNTQTCKGDGGWTEWSDWTKCSKFCNEGTKEKTRSCTNPVPSGSGKDCIGEAELVQKCNIQPCTETVLTSKSQAQKSKDGSDGELTLSREAIIGLSVGLAGFLLLIIVLLVVCVARRTRRQKEEYTDDFSVAYINNIYEEIPGENGPQTATVVNPNYASASGGAEELPRKISLDDTTYLKHSSVEHLPTKNGDEECYLEPKKAENHYVSPQDLVTTEKPGDGDNTGTVESG